MRNIEIIVNERGVIQVSAYFKTMREQIQAARLVEKIAPEIDALHEAARTASLDKD